MLETVTLVMADGREIGVTASNYQTPNPSFGRVLEFIQPPKSNALENARALSKRYGWTLKPQRAKDGQPMGFAGTGV